MPAPYAGRRIACTWQLGEPALIAAATGVPVVSNFRPADMAAGGQGAPLVPLLDYVLFAHPTRARVLQNIGGIGNLTVIPAAAPQEKVIAFDTGPGNMIIDALMQQLFSKPYDRNGRTAARGKILEPVLRSALKEKFFRQPPPKSAGREQFGAAYAQKFLAACRKHARPAFRPADAIATATALTVESIADAIRRWVLPLTPARPSTSSSPAEAHATPPSSPSSAIASRPSIAPSPPPTPRASPPKPKKPPPSPSSRSKPGITAPATSPPPPAPPAPPSSAKSPMSELGAGILS